MCLTEKFNLCYLNLNDLLFWIKSINVLETDFSKEKKDWSIYSCDSNNFFYHTELLLIHEDIVLLKAFDYSHQQRLVANYSVSYQDSFLKQWTIKRNLIVVHEEQWTNLIKAISNFDYDNQHRFSGDNAVVLLKDKESIKSNLLHSLQKKENQEWLNSLWEKN